MNLPSYLLFVLPLAFGAASFSAAPAANFRIINELPDGTEIERPMIVDPEGYEFIPIGGNMNGYKYGWSNPTLEHVDMVTEVWNFNTIRLNCYIKGYHRNEKYWDNGDFKGTFDGNAKAIHDIVKAYTDRKVVVIIEAHDWTGRGIDLSENTYSQDGLHAPNNSETLENPFDELGGKTTYESQFAILLDFFTLLAKKYRDNPYVWFNPMNEPGTVISNYRDAEGNKSRGVPEYWRDTHGEFVKAIRGTGNGNIIVIDGIAAGQDHGRWYGPGANDRLHPETSAILTYAEELMNYEGVQRPNLLFSFHLYHAWGYTESLLAEYIDYAHKRDIPLIIGEAGWYLNKRDSPPGRAFEWMWKYAPHRGVGVLVWHLQPGDGMALVPEGTFNRIDDVKRPSNLSWMGRPTWAITHDGLHGVKLGREPRKNCVIPVTFEASPDLERKSEESSK